MTRALYMGVDPGGKGSISIIDNSGSPIFFVYLQGMNCDELWTAFKDIVMLCRTYDRLYVIMEKVGGYKEGSKGNIGSRMFTFGASYGRLQMAMKASSISWKEVVPIVWQKEFKIITPKRISHKGKVETDSPELKRELKRKAQELFPDVKVTLPIADSLLIAEYCRRKNASN